MAESASTSNPVAPSDTGAVTSNTDGGNSGTITNPGPSDTGGSGSVSDPPVTTTTDDSSSPPPNTPTTTDDTTTQGPTTTQDPTTTQGPTTTPDESSSPPPSASPSQPTTTPPTTSDAPASSAPPTTPTVAPSFSASAAPSLVDPGTPHLTSGLLITTTDANGNLITTAPSLYSTTMMSTDSSGNVYTVTAVVHNTASVNGSSSRGGGSDFFNNTGAVAGVFVVVGLVVAAGIGAFTFFMLRRRRRQRLDRDVAAAAAAAAAAQQPRFEDDDDHSPAMTQYGGYYPSNESHIYEPSAPQSTRGYEYEAAGGYDPYAANLVDVPPLPGDQNGYHDNGTYPPGGGYYATNNGQPDFSQDYQHSYGDPQYDVAHVYASGPEDSLAAVPEASHESQYSAYNYGHDDVEPYNYNDFDMPPNPPGGHGAPLARPQSVGSVMSGAAPHRDLTVTNV